MKRIPFGGLKPIQWRHHGSSGTSSLSDNEENPLRGIETTLGRKRFVRRLIIVTMKRIPFGGLKHDQGGGQPHLQRGFGDNEENPLRGIETSDLTPRPPSLRGKGSRAPLPASGRGRGRGFFDLTPGPLP